MRGVAVGVDAGGTSTAAVVSDRGTIAGSAAGGAANASTVGAEAAAAAIARTIGAALGSLRADAVVVGAAGAAREDAAARLTAALREHFPAAAVEVCDDATIALRAGVARGDGVVLIAGTGSIAWASVGGKNYRSGGYGYLLGDEGSGYALGRDAARVLARALDGRAPRGAFVETIAQALGVADVAEELEAVYAAAHPVGRLASLAPLVIQAAGNGDRAANKIVQAAALELADLVKAVTRAAGVDEADLPIVFAGGLLKANSMLTFLLETRLNNELPHLQPIKDAPPPQFGALALAQQRLAESPR